MHKLLYDNHLYDKHLIKLFIQTSSKFACFGQCEDHEIDS